MYGIGVGSNSILRGLNKYIYTVIAVICTACMNINKVSRVKYWGGGLATSAPPPGSYTYDMMTTLFRVPSGVLMNKFDIITAIVSIGSEEAKVITTVTCNHIAKDLRKCKCYITKWPMYTITHSLISCVNYIELTYS